MEFPVHLRCSAVVAIVDCPDQGQFIGFLSLKQAALQSIWVFQESLSGGGALRISNACLTCSVLMSRIQQALGRSSEPSIC